MNKATMNDLRARSDSSDGEFGTLFNAKDAKDEVFTFESIDFAYRAEERDLSINFSYSFCKDKVFSIALYIDTLEIIPFVAFEELEFRRICFSIGMCCLPWLWMGFGTSTIILSESVAEFALINDNILRFWREVFRNIIAEYHYLNKAAPQIVTLECHDLHPFKEHHEDNDLKQSFLQDSSVRQSKSRGSRALVPLGGGKDSLVVWWEAIQNNLRPLLMYVSDGMFEFQENWRLPAIVNEAGAAEQCMIIKHHFFDENYLKLSKSYLNPVGHPWAALVLFDALLVAYLRGDISQIHLGHEQAADEGNGVFIHDGTLEVNHQYDKSSSFMNLAAAYIHDHIAPDITISAPLNTLSELEISRIFCQEEGLKPFHSLFLSCNEPVNKCEWCLQCEKCAFIFLLMSAWLGDDQAATTMFSGVNMVKYSDKVDVFLSLLGSRGYKPFDCVGTITEVKEAMQKIVERYEEVLEPLPVVLEAMKTYTNAKEIG